MDGVILCMRRPSRRSTACTSDDCRCHILHIEIGPAAPCAKALEHAEVLDRDLGCGGQELCKRKQGAVGTRERPPPDRVDGRFLAQHFVRELHVVHDENAHSNIHWAIFVSGGSGSKASARSGHWRRGQGAHRGAGDCRNELCRQCASAVEMVSAQESLRMQKATAEPEIDRRCWEIERFDKGLHGVLLVEHQGAALDDFRTVHLLSRCRAEAAAWCACGSVARRDQIDEVIDAVAADFGAFAHTSWHKDKQLNRDKAFLWWHAKLKSNNVAFPEPDLGHRQIHLTHVEVHASARGAVLRVMLVESHLRWKHPGEMAHSRLELIERK
eukprot:comp20758_c0_seq1/m.42731 comp20758_c0_seq1/g.42731  ORF comp20758_c0_seq1/g.42731 comp20758_c0_seq1/m.42731 type:complete len:327 (+) comp20758_c0_seq1:292-1272(+)